MSRVNSVMELFQYRVKGGQDRTEHDCCKETQYRSRQDVLDQRRVRHIEVGQYAAVTDELDHAGRYQKDRAEYAGKTGQQRAFLRFLQVLRAEYALHDGLVGAPVRDMVDTTAKYDHRPRNVRRLCVGRLDRIQVLRRGGSEKTDAFCDAAVAQRDKCQNRDQDDRADDQNGQLMPFRESDTATAFRPPKIA